MEKEAQPAPKIFISYSHDSRDHKRWVADLATKLMDNGINVILDQWELNLGDDVPKFMENSVTEAGRVLMICTEKYVHKANEGRGGVGYEAMIVTGELVQNLGTSKFIPVIRQRQAKPIVPKSVSTRLYVNLSHAENYEEEFERLLRELHNVPPTPKPPLGKNPYFQYPAIATTDTAGSEVIPLKNMEAVATDVETTYHLALELIRREDMIGWRRLVTAARKSIPDGLAKWRTKYEQLGLPSRRIDLDVDKLKDSAAEGIVVYAPLFAIALAGVVSGNPKFNNQVAILDDILYPKNWNGSGSTDIVYLPQSATFVYQALHGAACLSTEQLSLAVRLAREKVGEGPSGKNSVPLYKTSEIIGWPETLGRNYAISWDFLWSLPERWPWLNEIFGDADHYRISLSSYYMMLNIIELVDILADGNEGSIKGQDRLEVPLRTPAMPRETVRRAYRLLLNSSDQLRSIWTSRNVLQDKVRLYWPTWISTTARILRRSSSNTLSVPMVQESLFDDLN